MSIEIYWFSGSPFAWRAILAAEVKGIDYTSRLIQASDGDHRKPEFLAMSPRGKVPVLRDGDFVVTESLAILAYLDRRFPEPPLFGRTPEETGQIWRLALDFENNSLGQFMNIIQPIFFDQVEEKREQVEAAADAVTHELARLEGRLKEQPWLAGEAVSAADIAIYPFVEAVLRAAGKPIAKTVPLRVLPFEQTYPALAAWRQRVGLLPGYERAYPPHWRSAA